MKLYHELIFTFASNFLIQYFIFSSIVLNSISDFTNNISKIYISTIVGLVMVSFELTLSLLFKKNNNMRHYFLFLFLLCLLFTVIYLYRIQYAVDLQDFIKQRTESNSASLLLSEAYKKKEKVVKLQNKIFS